MLVLVLAILVVPSHVAAQASAVPVLTWQAEDMTPPVGPIDETSFQTTLEVACAPGSPASPEPWIIQVAAPPVDGLVHTVHPASFEVTPDPAACASGETVARQTVSLNLSITHDVVAGTELALTLSASEASSDEASSLELIVPAAPHIRYQSRFEAAIHKVAPGDTVQLVLVTTNVGNAPIQLTLTVAEGTSDELEPQLPPDLVVPVGEEAQFPIHVHTKGSGGLYENRRDQINLQVDAAWTEDPTASAEPIDLQAVIQQQGSPALPSPVALWTLIALLALAHTARSRT